MAHRDDAFFSDRPRSICVANGVLHLAGKQDRSGRIVQQLVFQQEFSPAFRCTEQLTVEWDPEAATFPAEDFFDRVLPDREVAEMILRLVGLAMLGDAGKASRILVLFGEGANGKGELCHFLSALFPPRAVTAIPPSMLVQPYERAGLVRSRLNIVGELDALSQREHTALKLLTGNDLVTARPVGGNVFSFRPEAQFIIATNHLPDLGQRTSANRRRFILIPMVRVIPEHERDPNIRNFLKQVALPGLLRMCVEAASRGDRRLHSRSRHADLSEAEMTPVNCRRRKVRTAYHGSRDRRLPSLNIPRAERKPSHLKRQRLRSERVEAKTILLAPIEPPCSFSRMRTWKNCIWKIGI